MKRFPAPTLLALALLSASAPAALATDIQKPVAPDSAAAQTPEARQQRQLANLMHRYEKVGLTEEQKNQIRPLLKSQIAELRAVRMDTNLSDEDRQLRARSILDGYRAQILSVLTPEQKVQLEEIRAANIKAAKSATTVQRGGRSAGDDN